MDEKKFVKICPKCGSIDINFDVSGGTMGMQPNFFCRDCKYGQDGLILFPEIEKTGVDKFRDNISNNK